MIRLLPIFVVFVLIISLWSYLPFRRYVVYSLGISGDSTTSCCDVRDVLSQSGAFDESADAAIFNSDLTDYPRTSLAEASTAEQNTQVLGTTTSTGAEKWIEVSLSEQHLRAWEGNKLVMDFPISSGLWHPTPTGTFNIWYKTRFQRMVGGDPALGTYYNLPNVPDNMFFYQGFALHGAYWHNNFGHPMSHGCVNEPLAQAAQMFEWAGPNLPAGQNAVRATADNPGTRVVIH